MTQFTMAEMSVDDAAKFLRNVAEVTAGNSQNWENFQGMAKTVIQAALDAGRKFGRDAMVNELSQPQPPT